MSSVEILLKKKNPTPQKKHCRIKNYNLEIDSSSPITFVMHIKCSYRI